MIWLEEDEILQTNPNYIVDYAYRIRCHSLPVEHAYFLAEAITAVLPWINNEPSVGIHSIHVADSGNGWIRPTAHSNNLNDLLYLPRRTRLVLRLPKNLVRKAQNLEGAVLDITGNTLTVEKGQEKPLCPSNTLFARYVVTDNHDQETRFMDYLIDQFQRMSIRVRKILCGREHVISMPKTPIRTRSVLIAELNPEESLLLQQNGIGSCHQLGCGLFIPHKDIAPVHKV
uniref:CRISPR-associated protein Cas6, subtype MYXAN n=1 Tax=Candidatus Kentrum sp. TUN TaxID=2126343 RepID=A0A450Z8U0_9GAMM|nr:MAG: CRISPR-associated protein Cas6, subtype MYXAN [Candidatus Kentron sp. TUN]VFK50805.1 MAG: CRISPR-associated protein Cas6, subtype MYXAN [Candidatus Kentron sp. TUN]VFK51274.1 MAG: CRISPR-associated protein Cas6, subtype MYXAN [Candidatus Kentron sp. TUN]